MATCALCQTALKRSTTCGWRESETGASAVNCGGATASLFGTCSPHRYASSSILASRSALTSHSSCITCSCFNYCHMRLSRLFPDACKSQENDCMFFTHHCASKAAAVKVPSSVIFFAAVCDCWLAQGMPIDRTCASVNIRKYWQKATPDTLFATATLKAT